MVIVLLSTACEEKEGNKAFLDIDSKRSSSIFEEELNVMSSLKVELLRNAKPLLELNDSGLSFICSSYAEQSGIERVDFWARLIYKLSEKKAEEILIDLSCHSYKDSMIERALCLSENLNSILALERQPIVEVIDLELLEDISGFPICQL